MAKKSSVEKNEKRRKMAAQYAERRAALKAKIKSKDLPADERFRAAVKLASLPRNSSQTRVRNRCELTGRPRGFYRKLKISRIALRQLTSDGKIPGMVKSSW